MAKPYEPQSLGPLISQFANNCMALRDFIELVGPALSSRFSDEVQANARQLSPLLIVMSRLGVTPELTPEEEARIRERFGANFELIPDESPEKKGFNISVDSTASEAFNKAIRVLFQDDQRRRLLYGSALISLLSTAEWFIAQMLHIHFRLQPGSLGLRDKVYSLDDLERIGSIDDARQHLIDRRIEDTLRGSIADWFDALRTKVGLSMGYVDSVRDELIELGQRRNIIVHNGGVINSTYLTNVKPALREGHKLGERIHVDRPYIEKAVSLIERIFVLIGAELWKKLLPQEEDRGTRMNALAFEHLKAERWQVAESLSYFVRNDKALPEHSTLIATVNYWQSLKWQDRFDIVRREVVEADFSAKDEIFQLARHVLLDQVDASVELLRTCMNTHKLNPDDAETWPLFRLLRQEPQWKQIVSMKREGLDA